MTSYSAIVQHLRRTFNSGRVYPLEYRKEQLRCLRRLLTENEDEICDAIYKDIKRSKPEAFCYEIVMILNEIDTVLAELDQWAKPETVRRSVLFALDGAQIVKDPLGVILIFGTWNYPINMSLCPLVGALAAGNCAIVKPSEISANTAEVVAKLVPKYLDQDVVRVICGGVTEATELLKERFDHIFYTGAPAVAKIIMEAASKHLTPVTLELGGKCPAIVDSTCDLEIVGKRIAWGKFMSNGQTCLAPDYVMCTSDVKNGLINVIQKTCKEFYTENPKESQDYSRVINERHFDRLSSLMKSAGTVVFGGNTDRSDLYIEPTILVDIKPTDPIMKDEIFGPIMPIIEVKDIDEAVQIVKNGEKPLACYIFSKNDDQVKKIVRETSSGGVTVNDVILHFALDSLPFGGVGHSGMGKYHGKYSFDTFSHAKSVLRRGQNLEAALWMRYPPFDDSKFKWAKILTKKRNLPPVCCAKILLLFLFGLACGYFLHKFI